MKGAFNTEHWPTAVQITSTRDDAIAGLDPHFWPRWDGPHEVSWHEGGHVRVFLVAQITKSEPDVFAFEDDQGDAFVFRPLTLERYNAHVRGKTMGRPTFRTEAEMIDAMRREW